MARSDDDERSQTDEEARMNLLRAQPLTAAAFAPFGEVMEASGDFRLINAGLCRRQHDLARLDFGPGGRAGISVFHAEPRALPYSFDLIERHPEGCLLYTSPPPHRHRAALGKNPSAQTLRTAFSDGA